VKKNFGTSVEGGGSFPDGTAHMKGIKKIIIITASIPSRQSSNEWIIKNTSNDMTIKKEKK